MSEIRATIYLLALLFLNRSRFQYSLNCLFCHGDGFLYSLTKSNASSQSRHCHCIAAFLFFFEPDSVIQSLHCNIIGGFAYSTFRLRFRIIVPEVSSRGWDGLRVPKSGSAACEIPRASCIAAMRTPESERTHARVGGPARRIVGNRLAVLVSTKRVMFLVS